MSMKLDPILSREFNSSAPGQNGSKITEAGFKRNFVNENVSISVMFSVKSVPWVQDGRDVIIGFDNGLLPYRWKAIIQTHDNSVQQRICVTLERDTLI